MKRIGKNETTEMAPVKKCFVGLETALYLLFLALDAFSAGGDGVKYLTIVVCLLAAVWSARHGGSRLMAWAMAFTLAADTFLLLLDRWYGAGIVLFCVVQGLYLARIRRACGRTLWALRTGLVPAAWVLLNALGMGTALNLLAALYFVNLLVNACQSLTLRSERLFAAGLWLFLLCDVCVGRVNSSSRTFLGCCFGSGAAGPYIFTGPQGCSSTGAAPGLEKCKGDMPMTNVRKNSAKLTREDLKIAPESPTMKLSETPAVEPSDQTSKTVRHAPLVYRVEEIAQLLAISNRAAYNLCNTTKDFKVIRLGTSIRVSKQSFDDWFAAV